MRSILAATIAALALALGVTAAHAACEGTSGTGHCNSLNSMSGTMPTTNVDNTAVTDFASVEVVFGPAAGVCATTVGTSVKNLGPLGVPATPVPNTIATTKLGVIGLPVAKVFAAMRVVDVVGNRSACSTPEMVFFYDGVPDTTPPNAPTNVNVAP